MSKIHILPDDFRPVSILLALLKVSECLITDQIGLSLNAKNLLSANQSGYKSGLHSCNTALLEALEDIRPRYDKGNLTILGIIDLSKAFDTIDCNLLLQKLEA